RDERPVLLVFRPLLDPALQQFLLGLLERLFRAGRRHLLVGVGGEDPGDQLAGLDVARYDRAVAALELLRRGLAEVEPQARLARLVGGAVAGEAVGRQDRLDVAGVGDLGGRVGGGGRREGEQRGSGEQRQGAVHGGSCDRFRPRGGKVRTARAKVG